MDFFNFQPSSINYQPTISGLGDFGVKKWLEREAFLTKCCLSEASSFYRHERKPF
jgi:hypothetical protein